MWIKNRPVGLFHFIFNSSFYVRLWANHIDIKRYSKVKRKVTTYHDAVYWSMESKTNQWAQHDYGNGTYNIVIASRV